MEQRLGMPGSFNDVYLMTPPWDIGRPQPAFVALGERGLLRGRVLDVGCGTGEHALYAASLGLEAWGVDSAPRAIEIAKRKAAERKLGVHFEVADALALAPRGRRFDTVLDSALFHVFNEDEAARYVANLAAMAPAGGRLFMLCFSDRVVAGAGPRRLSQAEIRAAFATGWRVDAIEAAPLDTTLPTGAIPAWLSSITRL